MVPVPPSVSPQAQLNKNKGEGMDRLNVRRVDYRLAKMLADVSPATIGHFVNSGFMSPRIKPVFPNVKIAGPALTVKIPANDSTMLHKAMAVVEEGDVIVVDRAGDEVFACVGEVLALAALMKKAAGIVIDGPATDVCEITKLGIPVFSTGLSVVTTKLYGLGGEINGTIQCGGATVNPGDFIFGDDNGVLVISPDDAMTLLEKAQNSERRELHTKELIRNGGSLPEISGANRLIEANVPKMIWDQRRL